MKKEFWTWAWMRDRLDNDWDECLVSWVREEGFASGVWEEGLMAGVREEGLVSGVREKGW